MHGGAPGSGGRNGPRNGNYRHGRYTAEAIASRRLRQFTRDVRTQTKLDSPHSAASPALRLSVPVPNYDKEDAIFRVCLSEQNSERRHVANIKP
jgi:hypothetical protein